MKPSYRGPAALLPVLSAALIALPARAALDYHTYAPRKHVERVLRDGKYEDSAWYTYDLTRLGRRPWKRPRSP